MVARGIFPGRRLNLDDLPASVTQDPGAERARQGSREIKDSYAAKGLLVLFYLTLEHCEISSGL